MQAIFSWLSCPLHSSVSIFNYFAYLNWLDTATGACPSVHVCLVRWLSHRFSVHRFLCHLQSEAKTIKVWHFYRRTLRLSQWIVVLFLSYTVFCLLRVCVKIKYIFLSMFLLENPKHWDPCFWWFGSGPLLSSLSLRFICKKEK